MEACARPVRRGTTRRSLSSLGHQEVCAAAVRHSLRRLRGPSCGALRGGCAARLCGAQERRVVRGVSPHLGAL
eukprot:2136471-Prymnesium_polylepis.1